MIRPSPISTLFPYTTLFRSIILQGTAELLIGRNYGVAMLAVTPLALLMVSLAHPIAPETIVVDRIFETFIGSLVGTFVALISATLRSAQQSKLRGYTLRRHTT